MNAIASFNVKDNHQVHFIIQHKILLQLDNRYLEYHKSTSILINFLNDLKLNEIVKVQ